jgi:sugar-specific transcriptional regulator TrmB
VTDGNALSALGLSTVEEEAYRTLLRLPQAGPAALAASLRLDDDEATRLLEGLVKRGLAKMVSDDCYAAAAPESSIVSLLADRLDALRRGYDAVGQLEQLYRDSQARYGNVVGSETVRGLVAMASRLGQLQDQARCQVSMLIRPPLISHDTQRPAYAAATARGVHYRTLYERSMLDDASTMEIVRESVAGGTAVRFTNTLPVKLVIIDGHTAFIVEPGDHPVALVTEHPALVTMACGLFDQVWSTAVPAPFNGDVTGERVAAPGPSDSDDRLLLSLLLSGLTDQAIAVRLGVGLRTVQRRVRDLMDAAEVDTRIQLGWQASRKGWVV